MARASSIPAQSPLMTTGMRHRVDDRTDRRPVGPRLDRIARASGRGRSPCARPRAPREGRVRAALSAAASQPRRILSVTGTETASTTADASALGMIEVAHQRAAGQSAGHASRRAAHVDVDDGGARRPRPGAPSPPWRGLAADELDGVWRRPPRLPRASSPRRRRRDRFRPRPFRRTPAPRRSAARRAACRDPTRRTSARASPAPSSTRGPTAIGSLLPIFSQFHVAYSVTMQSAERKERPDAF